MTRKQIIENNDKEHKDRLRAQLLQNINLFNKAFTAGALQVPPQKTKN